ncbi:MAG: type II secretion system protein [Anaerolineales bacterium]
MLKRLMVEEKGFTLVELLVTISILAVLFGIATLTLTGLNTDAQDTVCDAEAAIVQSAMDIYMAEDASNTIAASVSEATISAGSGGFTDYLRRDTRGSYTWEDDGDNLVQTDTTACPNP